MSSAPATASFAPSPWRWWVCGLLLFATTLSYMDGTALNQTAVRLSRAFQMDEEQYGNLESAFRLAFAVGTLFCGWIVDKGGVRWVYPICVAGWSAVGFLTGYADSYAVLFFCRFLLGLFEGGNWPCGIRTVRQIMPRSERSLGNSLFQSGTALGAIVTPFIVLECVRWTDPGEPARLAHVATTGGAGVVAATGVPPEAWRTPFQVIGLIGFAWVALWLVTVPTRRLAPAEPPLLADTGAAGYWSIFRDPRFYVCLLVVIAVNTSWHTVRVWLPKYLQLKAGYSEARMSYFMMKYYALADVGSWSVGLVTLMLIRKGLTVQTARVLMFAGCTGLVLLSALISFVGYGDWFVAMFLAYAFGALGLFPTYFALTQDLSSAHQGKVTGTLGCLNGLYLSLVYHLQGLFLDRKLLPDWAFDRFERYEFLFAFAGVPALIALVVLLLFWRKSKSA